MMKYVCDSTAEESPACPSDARRLSPHGQVKNQEKGVKAPVSARVQRELLLALCVASRFTGLPDARTLLEGARDNLDYRVRKALWVSCWLLDRRGCPHAIIRRALKLDSDQAVATCAATAEKMCEFRALERALREITDS
ncbi:hypothetical protein Rhal01_03820 [Rubritalea halochordaticola]|uniref:HEAT repeat domain-containing protein n=1 Tax=Rubritalea halochordaticola TaxID=714537 RepID=A0ABP9V4M8_9BACT